MEKMDNLRIRKTKVNVKGTLIEYDEYYLYLTKDMFNYLEKENKKSISYKEIKEKGKVIPLTLAPILDYLKIIDRLFF